MVKMQPPTSQKLEVDVMCPDYPHQSDVTGQYRDQTHDFGVISTMIWPAELTSLAMPALLY